MDVAGTVLELLQTARLAAEVDKPLKGKCDENQFNSIYRGHLIAQTAYSLFVSKLEKGWFEPNLPGHNYGKPDSIGLIHEKRISLLSLWNAELWRRVVEGTKKFRMLPNSIKSDLISFLEQLIEFKTYYKSAKRYPNKFSALQRRMELSYPSIEELTDDYFMKNKLREGMSQTDLLEYVREKTSLNEEQSIEYRKFLNDHRDVNAPRISKCLDGDYYRVQIQLGTGAAIKRTRWILPTKYSILFWQRRDLEGTTTIASFVIRQIIRQLKL